MTLAALGCASLAPPCPGSRATPPADWKKKTPACGPNWSGCGTNCKPNQTQVGGLELVLHQRLETIDALRGTIDQLRSANQKLGLENECLTVLLAAPPQLDAADRANFASERQ